MQDTASLVELFTHELTALTGKVHGPHTPEQALATVIDLLREAGGNEILAWDDDALPVDGFSVAAQNAGFVILDASVSTDANERLEKHAQLASASVGVTGAIAGLADTGSIVVHSDASRPRLASLLPPIHIALLRVADIYPSLPDFIAARSDLAQLGSNVVVISGPSRTADIELTPVVGVHGPRTVHVILVQ
jgi:L-lactate dehydrogenase complex protein LldG